MPELPEVHAVLRSIQPHLLGRTLGRVWLLRPDIVFGSRTPQALLQGETIASLARRGKQLALITASGRCLVVQLGMTGQFLVQPRGAPHPPHLHVHWQIKGTHNELWFKDPRRFGRLTTYSSTNDLNSAWEKLGVDALSVTGNDLHEALHASRRMIKAALLDQGVTAGIGNIYADESLHLSRLSPLTKCYRLTSSDFHRLAQAVRHVLSQAAEAGGSTLRDYVDADGRPGTFAARHVVYGRGGEPCTRCGITLRQTTVAQRTTVWCSACQPKSPARALPSSTP